MSKSQKKDKRIFLSKHESCIINITVRGLPGEIQKGSDLCHLFYTARKGGNHAETQKIYWEQTVLPDGAWRCDADYDSERYHQLCQPSRQHHGRTGRHRADVGVAIVNQLLFIYNLCIFGGVSGAGIFTAQYFGQGNDEGVRNTFRFKLWIGVILTAAAITIFLGAHEPLIRLYLTGDQGSQDMNATLAYGISYMKVMLVGLPPFLFVQLYASTLRECGETMLPMKAGITAVFVNLVLTTF